MRKVRDQGKYVTTIGGILLIAASLWAGIVLVGWLVGRAANQELYFGMLSPRDPDQEGSKQKGMRQQRAQGSLARKLIPFWPLATILFIAGIVLLAVG